MKILIIGLMALLLVSAFSIAVMAEDAVSNETASEDTIISPEPAETVDPATEAEINDELNDSAGAGTVLIERVKLWFTFNQEKKAQIELKIARLELVRARIAAKNNDTAAMEKALEAHNRLLEKVQARIEKLDGKATKAGIKDSVAKFVGLERAIQVHEARIAKLNEILAYENLTEEQIAIVQAKLDKAETNTAHLIEVQAAKVDKLKTRLMAVANMTEEQASAEVQKLEDAQNLTAVKELVAKVKLARNEKASEVISNVIEKLQARAAETGKNMTNAIEKLTLVQQKLQERAEALKEKAGKLNSDSSEEDEASDAEEPEEAENESEED